MQLIRQSQLKLDINLKPQQIQSDVIYRRLFNVLAEVNEPHLF